MSAAPTWSAFWQPGRALFSRLRFRMKALLISAVFFVPILIFGTAYLGAMQEQVEFVRQERAGVAALAHLLPVMSALAERSALARAELAGLATDAPGKAAVARVDQA